MGRCVSVWRALKHRDFLLQISLVVTISLSNTAEFSFSLQWTPLKLAVYGRSALCAATLPLLTVLSEESERSRCAAPPALQPSASRDLKCAAHDCCGRLVLVVCTARAHPFLLYYHILTHRSAYIRQAVTSYLPHLPCSLARLNLSSPPPPPPQTPTMTN